MRRPGDSGCGRGEKTVRALRGEAARSSSLNAGQTKENREKEMSESVNVRFRRVSPLAHVPTRGSEKAAGYDLYAALGEPVTIAPHETVKIDTGLQFEIPDGYFAAIYARSGIASKEGLRPANCTGVCDSDYRGNYIVALHNDSETTRTVEPGERIAQMVVIPYLSVRFEEAGSLTDTERGDGGFGSTGRK